MPGLYGVITTGRPLDLPGVPAAGNWPRYRPRELHREATALFGAYLRHRGPDGVSCHEQGGRVLALYGHCADPRLGGFLQAPELAELLQREGDAALDRLEGAFCALELDRSAGHLRLFNDRVGTLAVYWYHQGDTFAVAPRMGLLPAVVRDDGLNRGAVVNFLSVGHFLGPNTPLRGAHFLTPATIVTFDLHSGKLSQRRYWNLVYQPDGDSSAATLCHRLGESIQEATSLLVGPPDERGGIFLSGGWDSRSLLGASLAVGRPPAMVVTNGMSDEIPGSDTLMARQFAHDLDLPYRFCRRIPDIGPEAWLDGLHKGELTTANNPESFGQHALAADFFGDLDYMLKGDVTWGSGAPATSRALSIAKIVPFPLVEQVKAVMSPDLRKDADDLYMEQVESVISHCENDGWTERRDYLWQMGGINRYILGLGVSDEEHIQVRRPLLSGIVLRQYTTVPRHLRCNKNLFIETIRRFYPRLFAYGRNHVGNIAHYYHYMAPFVRERTLAHLDAGHDLDGLLDRGACRAVIEAFAPALDTISQPDLRHRIQHRVMDRHGFRWHRSPLYHEKNVKVFRTSPTMLAFHIYLLLEWHHGRQAAS